MSHASMCSMVILESLANMTNLIFNLKETVIWTTFEKECERLIKDICFAWSEKLHTAWTMYTFLNPISTEFCLGNFFMMISRLIIFRDFS